MGLMNQPPTPLITLVTTPNGHPVERERAAELRRGSEEGPLLTSSSTATRLFPSGRMNLIKIDEIGSLSPSSAGREPRVSERTELPSLSVKC